MVRHCLENRGHTVDVPALIALDDGVRRLKAECEQLRAEAKTASKAIGQVAREGQDVAAAKAAARELSDQAKAVNDRRAAIEDELNEKLMGLPNPCQDLVPVGPDESHNVVVRSWGELPELPCDPKPHWDIAPELGILDLERGARLSGSGFAVLMGQGARLERALVTWFLDHLREHGYLEIAAPFLVRSEALTGTGQLPKFGDQLYHCGEDDLYLIPTAEVPVTNLYAGEILDGGQLPKRFCAATQCFRREAGAAGVGTRGIQRVHQFTKVEMVWYAHPDKSEAALHEMMGHAEALLQALGLHYRVLELCTGDTGFGSTHTYDLEVWSPGTGSWLEVSSCSNCQDFQARRMGLRFRDEPKGKPQAVHTLNGSGLALPRVLIALLETGLQADGTVAVPEVLQPYLGGLTRIDGESEVPDEIRDECGIVAAADLGHDPSTGETFDDAIDVSTLIPSMLVDIQNRGQLAAGMTSFDPARRDLLRTHKDLGSVSEVFQLSNAGAGAELMRGLTGRVAIGHTRYSTSGADDRSYAQPLERVHGRPFKWFSFCFNGNVANHNHLATQLTDRRGYHLQRPDSDTELFLHTIAFQLRANRRPSWQTVFKQIARSVDGAWSLALVTAEGDLVVARDQLGIKPLCYGVVGRTVVFASESTALQNVGVKNIKDVPPGSLVQVRNGQIRTMSFSENKKQNSAHCFFEWVYFANVASVIDGRSVYQARADLGRAMAEIEDEVVGPDHIVVPVPDTSKAAGDAFAYALGIPSIEGLVRNRYLGRTFIQSEDRAAMVRRKFTALRGSSKVRRSSWLMTRSCVRRLWPT